MSSFDAFTQAEETVSREIVYIGKKKDKELYVYTLKLSNAESVVRQCFDFIKEDSLNTRQFTIIFNAKHVKPQTVPLMALEKLLADYKTLLFNAKLYRFVIIIKNFTTHRRVIGLFDRIFDEAKMSRSKYNYFPLKDKDKIMNWLVSK